MKDLRLKIFQLTGKSDVFEAKPSEVAQIIIEEILPDENKFVSDKFMELMSEHLHKFFALNPRIWTLFAEICMQRISESAMLMYDIHHEYWLSCYTIPANFKKVRQKYLKETESNKVYNFADMIPQPDIINKECVKFLYCQSNFIFKHSKKSHMRDILVALIDDMSDEGEYQTILVSDDVDKISLMKFAQKTVYDNIPSEDIIEHISKKDIWYKHLPYIKKHWELFNNNDFATKIGMRGPFKRIRLYCKVFL